MKSDKRAQILLLAVILLLALGVRLLTFERHLPYVDYADEANMFLLAVDWRGDFPLADAYGAGLTGARLAGYPPLYPWVAIGVQHVVEAVSTESFLFSGDYVYGLRLLAIIAGVLTAAALWVIGWTLGGVVAAALSALVWALSPVVVEWNSLAVPDPLVYLASGWTLAFALWAWHKNAPAWTLPSLVCAVAAIYLKYTPLHVLVMWGGAVVVLLLRDWRRTLPWLLLEGVIGLASAAYLLFGYGALRLENDEAMRVDPAMALNMERGLRNLEGTLLPVGVWLFVAVGGVALIVYAYSRRRSWPVVDWRKALYLVVVLVVGVVSVSTFIGIEPYSNQMRHVLPVAVVVIGLWGMGASQIAAAFRAINRAGMALVAAALIAALFTGAAVRGDLALIQRFEQPDPRYELWQWSDASLPPEGKILMFPDSTLRAVWNRPYSGYDGQTAFDWAFDTAPYQSTPQALYEQGVAYFALTGAEQQAALRNPDMAAFLGQLLLLNVMTTVPVPDLPETIYFYRLIPPQVEANALFAEQITLVGYDLDVAAGSVFIRPYWQAQASPAANYSMFIHFTEPDTLDPLAQYDGAPASARRPATSWQPGEILIGTDARIDLPPQLPPGEYQLRLGLYNYETGQRLLLGDGADAYMIDVEIPGNVP